MCEYGRAIGVVSVVVLGPAARMLIPKPECHQRRDQRHEAGGEGYWFDCGAGGVRPWADEKQDVRDQRRDRRNV